MKLTTYLHSNADIKNELHCSCSHPVCFHGVDRNNFTVLPYQPSNQKKFMSSVLVISIFLYIGPVAALWILSGGPWKAQNEAGNILK